MQMMRKLYELSVACAVAHTSVCTHAYELRVQINFFKTKPNENEIECEHTHMMPLQFLMQIKLQLYNSKNVFQDVNVMRCLLI